MVFWQSSDGLLSVKEPSLTGPLIVTRRDIGESFVYDPFTDGVEGLGDTGGELARELRVQLDEIRGNMFRSRALLGFPLSLAEVLWRPRIYFHANDAVFVVPNTADGDIYPREVRYGTCDLDGLLSSEAPFDSLVFEGYQMEGAKSWVRRDGQVTPVIELFIAHAPLSSATYCSSPWTDQQTDEFLAGHDRDGWEGLFLPTHGVFV